MCEYKCIAAGSLPRAASTAHTTIPYLVYTSNVCMWLSHYIRRVVCPPRLCFIITYFVNQLEHGSE